MTFTSTIPAEYVALWGATIIVAILLGWWLRGRRR